MDGLTVGRNVHYVTGTGVHLMANVVHVWDKDTGMVNLTVFNNHTGDHGDEICWARTSVTYSNEHNANSWHWIERA